MATMNPYLGQMGNAIANQANQNLQFNVLPGVNSGAVAAGGYGGSRQGIAQGLAMGLNQQGISNSLANLYGQAYEGDQNRANTMGIAKMQDSTNRYGIDQSTGLGYAGLKNQFGIASMNDATNRYGIDQQTGLGYAGLANTKDIATMNDSTNRYGIDTSADTSRFATSVNRDLGINRILADMNIAGENRANQYNIAQMGDATSRYGIDSQTGVANMNNATTRELGLGRLNIDQQQTDNSYELGLGNLASQNRGLDQSGARLGMDMYGNAIDNTMKIGEGLYQSGQREMNAPNVANQQYQAMLQGLMPYTGTGFTQGPSTGGGIAGAAGGALTAAQMYQLLMGGKP